MRRAKYYLLGSLCLVLAILFFVVPGPSIIFLLLGLVCFSMVDDRAKVQLKKVQRVFKQVCVKLDASLKK